MKLLLYISKTDYKDEVSRLLTDALSKAYGDDAELRHEASLKGLSPTLVHVFGCWSWAAADMVFKAHGRGIPTVYSPLGGLMPWQLQARMHSRRIQTRSFQKRMTVEARALLAFSKLEGEQLLRSGWNEKVLCVDNSFVTNCISKEEMIQKIRAFYQKVIDSNSASLLSLTAITLIGRILQASLDRDSFLDEQRKAELLDRLQELGEEEWRSIFLYADDELALDHLRQGIDYLKVPAPEIPVEEIDRFAPCRPYSEQPLAIEGAHPEREIAEIFRMLQSEIRRGAMPLGRLAELYRILRFTDYDEAEFARLVKQGRQEKFVGRMLGIMADILGLTEGFMPLAPIHDSETERLARNITKTCRL